MVVVTRHWYSPSYVIGLVLFIFLMSKPCFCRVQYIGKILPGTQISQLDWIDREGKFLLSQNQNFALAFVTTANDTTKFLLVIVHLSSTTVIWTANRAKPVSFFWYKAKPVSNSDEFVFDKKGNAFLQKDGVLIWSTNTINKGVSSMVLQDNGNLVLLGSDNSTVIWQSFDFPTDTLLSEQVFKEGMKLTSEPNSNNLTYVLEIKSGNVVLSAAFKIPQVYWSMQNDNRKLIDKDGHVVVSSNLTDNSWRFYNEKKSLLWQFIFSDHVVVNATWIAVLGRDGVITFSGLNSGGSVVDSSTRIPHDPCGTPQPCDPYNICTGNRRCSCPSVVPSCKPGFVSACDEKSEKSIEFLKGDDGLDYFALDFLQPFSKTNLVGCQTSCRGNCSCLAMFFHTSSGNCFLLESVGSFKKSDDGDSGYVSYIKVSSNGNSKGSGSRNKHIIAVVVTVILLFVISLLLVVGVRYYRKKKRLPESPGESEEDNFLENLTELKIDEHDDRAQCAIRVALWCIQEDMSMRPSMTKVVQMLEGLCPVPKLSSEGGNSSGPSDCNGNGDDLSAVRLSGPR
ncbi:non-specific serine/threonine protein kinase [Trifolium repens]|nr:non-specific serine/threonine protein kinase [Trifolium repens]